VTSAHVLTIADNLGLSAAPEACVDFVCTSPPYVTTTFERGQAFPYDSFIDYLQEVFAAVYWVLKPGCSFALNVADILTKYRYKESSGMSRASLGCDALTAAQNAGFRLFERFIWDKGLHATLGDHYSAHTHIQDRFTIIHTGSICGYSRSLDNGESRKSYV